MRVKLDENLGRRLLEDFRSTGHDAATVADEQLCGAADERLFAACRAESRLLVTLDLDFASLLRFPVEDTAGVAILRLPESGDHQTLRRLAADLLAALAERSPNGRLWIVEPGRIRERAGLTVSVSGEE